jgi:hypothetical protein
MTAYPLLFTFLDKVEGNNYLADVAVHGRLLATEEDGIWWAYGVNPGGGAASGATLGEAYVEFRKIVMKVLFDIASEADDFYAFRESAKEFFEETNEPTLKDWEAAREQVRAGKITLGGMRRESAESPRRIDIKQKQTFSAKGNTTDPQMAVAA